MSVWPRLIGVLCAMASGVSFGAAPSEAGESVQYPAAFESAAQLRDLGIAYRRGGGSDKVEPFANRCYWFSGHDNVDISVSDEFLAQYTARGFSLNSLCLALQSPLHFDPETGRVLPSYMIAKLPAAGSDEGVNTSPVYPLAVPSCFKRGLPYHDCKMNFSIKTGERLNPGEKAAIVSGRLLFDRKMAELKHAHAYSQECDCSQGKSHMVRRFKVGEMCRVETFQDCESKDLKGRLHPEGAEMESEFGDAGISVVDLSPSLPLGYGYGLQLDNGAGPDGGDASVAENPKHHVTEKNFAALTRDIKPR